MNWEIIETPKQQRFEIAEQANRCVKWLTIQGFDVLRVYKGLGSPLITIRPSPLCDKLEGAVAVYERNLKGAQRYKKVLRLDCEVRWEDKGGTA
jgi:hypothetical protein